MRLRGYAIGLTMAAFFAVSPILAAPAAAQDCVRTVRSISDFNVQGDGWMWWAHSTGYYEHDSRPALGSVLVFKRSSHMRRGHVSLVSAVIDRRTIEVDHSWLDGRGLRRGMRVVDVSPRNDWSQVRVWHEPTAQMGQTSYPTYGFILPEGDEPRARVIEVADREDAATGERPRHAFTVAPTGRGNRRDEAHKALVEASARGWVLPAAKPSVVNASLRTEQAAPAKPATRSAGVAPRRKPATAVAHKPQPPKRETVAAARPPRKPGTEVASRD